MNHNKLRQLGALKASLMKGEGTAVTVAELLGSSSTVEGDFATNRAMIDAALSNRRKKGVEGLALDKNALSEMSEAKVDDNRSGVIVDTVDEVVQVLEAVYL